ncbi:MAG: hypothetical protein QOJ99_1825 [Bryobacterales bacterium]|jgi:predicted nucleic acid-binding protein|nr:hypothetical protein [Bryobacterales bacterium]
MSRWRAKSSRGLSERPMRVAPDLAIADAAARIRAHHRLRTPDALQVATGVCSSATALLTNDPDLARVDRIEVGLLDRLR